MLTTFGRPYTEETLEELGSSGVKNLIVVPVSFVSEHIETLVSYMTHTVIKIYISFASLPSLMRCEPCRLV